MVDETGLRLADALQSFLPKKDWESSWRAGHIDSAWPKLKKLLVDEEVVARGSWDGRVVVEIEPQLWDRLEPRARWLRERNEALARLMYDHPTSRELSSGELLDRALGDPIHDAEAEGIFRNVDTGDEVRSVRFRDPRKQTKQDQSIRAERECEEWLRKIKNDPERQTKRELEEVAIERFKVSQRGWHRVWKKVMDLRGGRPKKNSAP